MLLLATAPESCMLVLGYTGTYKLTCSNSLASRTTVISVSSLSYHERKVQGVA